MKEKIKHIISKSKIIIKVIKSSDIYQITHSTVYAFQKKGGATRAAVLTYYCLLSIIPLVAVFFGIAKGFNFENTLKHKILAAFENYPEMGDKIFEFVDNLLDKTSGGIISGIGLVILLYTLYSLLSNIELVVDNIWNLRKTRSLSRKVTDYFSIIFIFPIFILLAGGIQTLTTNYGTWIIENLHFIPFINHLIYGFLSFLPFLFKYLIVVLLFIFIPNTNVKISYTLIAAFATSILYFITEWALIKFQVGVARNNAIYGSFAAIPLFLIWLQFSWNIVLFGVCLNYILHSRSNTADVNEEQQVAPQQALEFSFVIVRLIADNFSKNNVPTERSTIFNQTKIPKPIINYLIRILENETIIYATSSEKNIAYLPGKDLPQLTIKDIFIAVQKYKKVTPNKDLSELSKKIINKVHQRYKKLLDFKELNIKVLDV